MSSKLTPQQKLKQLILHTYFLWEDEDISLLPDLTGEEVDELYSVTKDLTDAIEQIRCNGHITGLPTSEFSRNYEDKEVAVESLDGSWVGFTYWYGGGKLGEPEDIPWMEKAYEVTMEEVMQPVKVFTKVEN